jgi:diguanylate cyclase (GGDEF)-like protein
VRRSRESALARAARALNESLDRARVLPRLCREAAAALGADAASIYVGGPRRQLALEAASPGAGVAAGRVAAQVGVAGAAVGHGRTMVARELNPEAVPEAPAGGIRSAMATPVCWDGELRGVLWAGYRHPWRASEDDADLLEAFAELAATALRNSIVSEDLAAAASTDGLTGCLNHAALHETLRRELQRSRRTARPLSVVLVDLDHFKQVNEQGGHLVGDEVLRRVGAALRRAVRPYDFVARYGGDEFAIVAVDADEARATDIARRAIDRLAAALADLEPLPGGPPATAGVASAMDAPPPAQLLGAADRALLYGKHQGVRGTAIAASSVPAGFELGQGDPASPRRSTRRAAAQWGPPQGPDR